MFKKVASSSVSNARYRRQRRVRSKVFGTGVCPRLNVFRSSNHIYAQIINDDKQSTLAFASSLDEVFKKLKSSNKEIAKKVGKLVGERATAKNISCVVFDRAGYLYHGRVKELADGAREAGLKF